jgi:hypothetical protein
MKGLAAAAAAIATALSISACGSSAGLIPTSNAATLQGDLSQLSLALTNHDCGQTQTALHSAETDFYSLPATVDTRLQQQLRSGLAVLTTSALKACKPPNNNTGQTGPTSTGPTGPTSTGPTGTTGTTSSTSSSSTTSSTSSTTSSTSSVATSTSSSAATTGDGGTPTGPTGTTCPGSGGGTAICDNTTTPTNGIGAPGN